MTNFTNEDAVLVGTNLELIGSNSTDTIEITGSFLGPDALTGLIDGSGGSNSLVLAGADLLDTEITNISETTIYSTRFDDYSKIDLSELGELGTIRVGQTSSEYTGGSLQIFGLPVPEAPENYNFDINTDLEDGQRLTVTFFKERDPQEYDAQLILDFSGGTFRGDSYVGVIGSSRHENTIIGGTGADTLLGSYYSDTLIGGDGDDRLVSFGANNNIIFGGNGNDYIELRSQTDDSRFWGGAGNDVFDLSSFTNGVVHGGAGTDSAELRGDMSGTKFRSIENTKLGTSIKIDADQLKNLGELTLPYRLSSARIDLLKSAGQTVVINARLEDNERLTITETSDNKIDELGVYVDLREVIRDEQTFLHFRGDLLNGTVVGGDGAERLESYQTGATIYGGGGDDEISIKVPNSLDQDIDKRPVAYGGDGNDTISVWGGIAYGDLGNDTITLISRYSKAYGGAGYDIFDVGSARGQNWIEGGAGMDTLRSYFYENDFLEFEISGIEFTQIAAFRGTSISTGQVESLGEISLTGTALDSGIGRISLYADEAEEAHFRLRAEKGQHFEITSFGTEGVSMVVGFSDSLMLGNSYVVFEGSGADETVLGSSENDRLYGNGGDDTLFGNDGKDLLSGDVGSDSLYGGRSSDRIYGGNGADSLFAGHGNDTLKGGDGDDILSGGIGKDRIVGGDGNDTASYIDSTSAVKINLRDGTASGGDAQGDKISSTENLTGSDFGDILIGDAHSNILRGLGGVDVITGLGGADILIGGDSADRIYGGDGDDALYGGIGRDRIFGGEGNDTALYFDSTSGVKISLRDGTASGGDARGDKLSSIENLTGSQHRDKLVGDENSNILDGLGGVDILIGLGGADTLFGGSGADRVYGGDGDDFLSGGIGKDRIVGGNGNDTALYINSKSAVKISLRDGTANGGSAQEDQLSSIENIIGSSFNDKLIGNSFSNVLHGEDGVDVLSGLEGEDILFGGNGSDRIYGGSDEDTIFGGDGNDALKGGNDDDILYGGAGDDVLNGGAGNDTFVFLTGFGHDVVVDFDTLVDDEAINLSNVTSIVDFADLSANYLVQFGNNAIIILDENNTITLLDISAGDLSEGDFIF